MYVMELEFTIYNTTSFNIFKNFRRHLFYSVFHLVNLWMKGMKVYTSLTLQYIYNLTIFTLQFITMICYIIFFMCITDDIIYLILTLVLDLLLVLKKCNNIL